MSDEEPPKRRWKAKPPKAAGGGERQLQTRVKNKKLDESSRNWVKRHLNDPYVARARADGYRARAAYKLIELDEQFQFLKRGLRVIDLGAAPGGWAQVCVKRGCKVVGVDLLPIDPLEGATFFQMDLTDPATPPVLLEALGGPPDLVLSDMAANTTGHAKTDQVRTGALAEAAAEFALAHLAPGGAFVTKAFQGGLDTELLTRLKQGFATVRHAKPPASRAESSEVYVVAMGRKA
ncbi:MAG TPA: RlmE family RNA methyltransferase [Vitreimonas sp.]|uniref:RlmE family RNA methyltransferase n=1 Tax=Vitreimonas sp. TaxID=3069702 RepID=UPI002D32DDC3|nr:RlmE family RNA methyltransferase [Vitreimonas sp.]HYD89249.1 RlmE family RNA methyltransferase [Vitreimonas sp.]